MVSPCENTMRQFVMLACLTTSFAAGCSETPSASLPPTNSAADGSKIESDPVDSDEIERNEYIFSVQKVRNPFIDAPELADEIADF